MKRALCTLGLATILPPSVEPLISIGEFAGQLPSFRAFNSGFFQPYASSARGCNDIASVVATARPILQFSLSISGGSPQLITGSLISQADGVRQ